MPSLIAILGLDGSTFKHNLDVAREEAREAGKEIASSLGDVITEKLGEIASLDALEEIGRQTFEYAEQVSDLAQRLGISTDAVQAWDYALKMNGSSIERATRFFEKLAIARQHALSGGQDAEKYAEAFQRLGVAAQDLQSGRLEDIAGQIARVFQSGDPQALIADLRKVGGRGAGEMVAAFREGLSDLVDDAREQGIIIGENVINGLRVAAERGQTVWMEFRAGIAPLLEGLATLTQGLWRGLNTAVRGAVGDIYGLLSGTGAGGAELVKEYQDQLDEQEKAAEEDAEARKKSFSGGVDAEEAADKEKKGKDEVLSLQERLNDLQEQGLLKGMTSAERVNALMTKRNALQQWLNENQGGLTEENKLKGQIDLQKLQNDIDEAQRAADREAEKKEPGRSARSARSEVNSLQRIGAFAATDTNLEHLNVARKSEQHLAGIHQTLQDMHRGGGGSTHY